MEVKTYKESMSKDKDKIVTEVYEKIPTYKDDITNPKGQGFIGESRPTDIEEARGVHGGETESYFSAEEGDLREIRDFIRTQDNPFTGRLEHHALPGTATKAYELPPPPPGHRSPVVEEPEEAEEGWESRITDNKEEKKEMNPIDRPTIVTGPPYPTIPSTPADVGGIGAPVTNPSYTSSTYPAGIVSDVGGSNPQMKCIVLTGFGGAKNVKLMMKDRPQPQPNEVIIKSRVCGINFQDIMTRQGVIDNPPKTPFIMGGEVGGEIIQCGSATTKFLPGDRVIAFPEFRAWAEYVAVPERLCFKLPDTIDFQDGVALALDSVVAETVLFELGNLKPGKTILVQSAAGGVGQMICQMAKSVENVTVVGIASGHKEEDLKPSIDVFIERGVDYVHEIRKFCPMGVDLVLDCQCGEEFSKCYSLLKPMGRYILYGTQSICAGESKSFFSVARSWWQVEKLSPLKMYDENKMVAGFNFRHLLYKQREHAYIDEALKQVWIRYLKREIRPVIDSTWCFEDIPEAMLRIIEHLNFGKIVLDPQMRADSEEAALSRGLNKNLSLRPESTSESENKTLESRHEGVGFIEAIKETLMGGESELPRQHSTTRTD
ncbi:synaptic vesicle membrane protein VAT-1 homolog-like isoform X2 [Artemia franciscana]|uniref:synaptic vesicle membrane protein VAT-1 homolog-like isoform X2 n=1 Tax=Artemia franciscana TaxID=6661 RepID=UPI0032DBEB85